MAGDAALTQTIAALRAAGSTVVVMAHRPSVLAAVNKLMVLDAGMIRVFGDKDEVLAEDFKVVSPSETSLDAADRARPVIDAAAAKPAEITPPVAPAPPARAEAPADMKDDDGNGPDASFEGDTPPASMSIPVLALAEAQEFASAGSLIIAYASARPDRVAALRVAVDEIRLQANRRQQIVRAESAIEDGQYQDALLTLAALTRGGTSDDEVAVLEQRARAALDKRAEEQKVLKARQLQQEQQRLVKEQRLADAYERQKQRRSDYRQYLNSARWALQNDNIEMARKWFDSASAMQITDAEFTELEARLEAAEAFLQTPLSNYEVSYARGQFNALRRAVELKNLVAIEELVGADSPRLNLFRTLFKRYRQITVKIMDVEPKLDPKRVSATLRIEKMALPNGDVVYPSASYRDSDLTIERQRYTWSPIRW
jgi:hypothetical protein